MGCEYNLALGVCGVGVIGDCPGHRPLNDIAVEDVISGRRCAPQQFVPNGFFDEFFRGLKDEHPFSGAGEFTGSVDYLMGLAGAAGSGGVLYAHRIPIENLSDIYRLSSRKEWAAPERTLWYR
jgi:hypothetical protein